MTYFQEITGRVIYKSCRNFKIIYWIIWAVQLPCQTCNSLRRALGRPCHFQRGYVTMTAPTSPQFFGAKGPKCKHLQNSSNFKWAKCLRRLLGSCYRPHNVQRWQHTHLHTVRHQHSWILFGSIGLFDLDNARVEWIQHDPNNIAIYIYITMVNTTCKNQIDIINCFYIHNFVRNIAQSWGLPNRWSNARDWIWIYHCAYI